MKAIIGDYDDAGKRETSIEISGDDMFDMSTTLALIIVPMLKKQREYGGWAHIDPADSPVDLPSDEESPARWQWILDEMIWAFEQVIKDDVAIEEDARIKRGTMLFGKYYRCLWT